MTKLTVVGDAFLDLDWLGQVDRLCSDAPAPVLDTTAEVHRPGGAGLAALSVADLGAEVTLVTALGDDAEGARVRTDLDAAGVRVVDLGLAGGTPVKLRLRTAGQSLARIDRNCSEMAAVGEWSSSATAAVEEAAAVLVSDYGRGLAGAPALSVLVHQLRGRTPVVWDPHPRGARPPYGALDVMTPNLAEASQLTGAAGTPPAPNKARLIDVLRLAEQTSGLFDCPVAVTAGERGAVLAEPGREPVAVPVDPVHGDPCGAGDRFAATVVVERAHGMPRDEAVERAVEQARRHVAGEWQGVSGRRGPWNDDRGQGRGDPGWGGPDAVRGSFRGSQELGPDAVALARSVEAEGGTVVAAGGCFDVVHAGHVQLLESARRLGDCLVVCLNGDISVRRLKGRPRPIHPVADRARVLLSLACVDAVMVFEEDTPCEALRTLRPQLFVKGSDYAEQDLPEREVLAAWGGRVALLPVLQGRSTTRILQAVAAG